MDELKYIKHEPVSLKNDPVFTETWLRERIEEDPAIIGLGDLELKDVERMQPKAGRLDLLLRDPETERRYEVELMLGTVDESHIIRAVEYWDIEKKRYPQYDHCAVIIAENITYRFLNVISLFNNAIPIIAIQLNALKIDSKLILNFTKVLDEIERGDDDETENGGAVTNRAYWEGKGSKNSVEIADACVSILQEIIPGITLKYNKYYIGLSASGKPNNFIVFRAKKKFIRAEARISDKVGWLKKLDDAGITTLTGGAIRGRINFQLTKHEVEKNRLLLRELFEQSYTEQQS